MKLKTSIFTLLFVFSSSLASAMAVKTGEIQFTAIGNPGFLKIKGKSKDTFPKGILKWSDQGLSGEFQFSLEGLKTGIELRDEHMKEKYLEIKKFPMAILDLDPMKIDPEKLDESHDGNFQGNLSLHGVSKKVSGKYKYDSNEKKIAAEFEIKVSDFGIEIPSYLGITVGEKVNILVTAFVEK